jgi:hypothetical protein
MCPENQKLSFHFMRQTNNSQKYFSAKLVAEACTNHMCCSLEGCKGGWDEARKHRTYSGAKHSIVEHWFPVEANCFIRRIFMQGINYS